jgi:putative transposase
MGRLNELRLQHPFIGVRMLRDQLLLQDIKAGRKRMDVTAMALQTGTCKRAPDHKIYLDWYNSQRPHTSLEQSTPDQAYFTGLSQFKLAA